MPASTTRVRVARLHRWLALALSPVIVVILVSGIVLAFRPIVGARDDDPAAQARPLNVPRALALADSLDPQGASHIVVFDRRAGVLGIGDGHGRFGFHDLVTGRAAPAPAEARRAPTVFDVAERIHRGGWIAGDVLVSLGTLAMIVLVIAGPFLARPNRGRSALSWHIRAGWFLWPLVALLPLSLAMTKLRAPHFSRSAGAPMSVRAAVSLASRTVDVTRLDVMQRVPGGFFMVVDGRSRPEAYIVNASGAYANENAVTRAGRALHEGTWAGAWSGLLNVLAALVTLVMLGTGITSWLKRRKPASAVRLAKAA